MDANSLRPYQFTSSILRSAFSKFFLGYSRTQLFAPRTDKFPFPAISLSGSKDRHNGYREGMKKAQTHRQTDRIAGSGGLCILTV